MFLMRMGTYLGTCSNTCHFVHPHTAILVIHTHQHNALGTTLPLYTTLYTPTPPLYTPPHTHSPSQDMCSHVLKQHETQAASSSPTAAAPFSGLYNKCSSPTPPCAPLLPAFSNRLTTCMGGFDHSHHPAPVLPPPPPPMQPQHCPAP